MLLEVNSETVPGSETFSTIYDKSSAVILEVVISETVAGSESSATTCEFQKSCGWACDVASSAQQRVWDRADLELRGSKVGGRS